MLLMFGQINHCCKMQIVYRVWNLIQIRAHNSHCPPFYSARLLHGIILSSSSSLCKLYSEKTACRWSRAHRLHHSSPPSARASSEAGAAPPRFCCHRTNAVPFRATRAGRKLTVEPMACPSELKKEGIFVNIRRCFCKIRGFM
jgi:hypothetical protein